MGLTNVWVRTLSDGLIRADHIMGIDAHRTPPLAGKHAHWLLDAILPAPVGSGRGDVWDLSALHRTLLQTPEEPVEGPVSLARLLAQLDAVDVAGVIVLSAVRLLEIRRGVCPSSRSCRSRQRPTQAGNRVIEHAQCYRT